MGNQKNSEENLTESISNEIINTTIDLEIEYAELTLDNIFDENVMKEIPFVKTLYAIGKIGYNVKERFFVKKILSFLKELHSKTIDIDKLNEFKEKFGEDLKYRNKVTELIMVYNDSFMDIEKSKVFARLFNAYISGAFDWNYFRHLTSCLNHLQIEGFNFLSKLSNSEFKVPENREKNSPPRDRNSEAILSAGGIAFSAGVWSSGFYVTDTGKDLYNYGIKE